MKATIEIPDDLYRLVKAKSALEGRPVREVTAELFRRYVAEREPQEAERGVDRPREPVLVDGEPAPAWFGVLRPHTHGVQRHDLEAIRESVARGIAAERTG